MECCLCSLGLCALKLLIAALVLVVVYIRLTIGRCKSSKRLEGKVVIITGANSGIGREAARDLLKRGARVILACRNLMKANEVASEFRDEILEADVSVKQLDLCDFDSVRNFASEILKEEKKIDILINNAGLSGDLYKKTVDGFEEIYQANYLGPFLLTELLLPLLKKSSPSRIINTGSMAYMFGKINEQQLETELRSEYPRAGNRYCDSKLAMLMWTRGLGAELKNSGVTVNVIHPGVVWSNFAGGMVTFDNMMTRFILFVFGRNSLDGAQTLIHLSVDSIADRENGQYWAECAKKSTWRGNDESRNKFLVEGTRKLLKLKDN